MERRAGLDHGVGALKHRREGLDVGERAVRRRVHVREVDDGTHPRHLGADRQHVVERAELAHAAHHLDPERDAAPLRLEPLAQVAELVDDVVDCALAAADAVFAEAEAPFHIHFSDIAYANRNETKHLPYGEGTLRADGLRDALARFDRPATVISEAPDEESTRVVQAILRGQPAPPRVSSTPRLFDP